jgi:hypothetical protein
VISAVANQWADAAQSYFHKNLGAEKTAARKFALLYVESHLRGLRPRIARVYSSPEHQRELQQRYDAGQSGFNARPATNSKHIQQDFWHNPASKAMDMNSDNDTETAKIAREIGLGAGEDFKNPQPDRGHYFLA